MEISLSEALNVFILTSSVAVYTLFRLVISEFFYNEDSGHFKRFILDYLSLVVPLFTIYTFGEARYMALNAVILFISFVGLKLKFRLTTRALYPSFNSDYIYSKNKTYITTFRSFVTLSTIICILAVDFQEIFPDHFGKSYHFGYSLMDTGVGSFVFMAGLVAPESRTDSIIDKKMKTFKKSTLSALVLAIIGISRTVVLTATGYSFSSDEYGRDWNFFMTLAAVKILSSIVLCAVPRLLKKSWIIAIVIAVCYQVALSKYNLEEILRNGFQNHHAHEFGFINANREGLFSSIGMLAIYFAGLAVGTAVFKQRDTYLSHLYLFGGMVLTSLVAWAGTAYLHWHVQVASRCFGNITYFAWTVAHNLSVLSSLFFVELIFFILCRLKKTPQSQLPEDTPTLVPGGCPECYKRRGTVSCACMLSAVSNNQLFYFLLGNVLTGLFNFTTTPREAEPIRAILSMNLYLLTVNGIICVLFVYKWSLKFW